MQLSHGVWGSPFKPPLTVSTKIDSTRHVRFFLIYLVSKSRLELSAIVFLAAALSKNGLIYRREIDHSTIFYRMFGQGDNYNFR